MLDTTPSKVVSTELTVSLNSLSTPPSLPTLGFLEVCICQDAIVIMSDVNLSFYNSCPIVCCKTWIRCLYSGFFYPLSQNNEVLKVDSVLYLIWYSFTPKLLIVFFTFWSISLFCLYCSVCLVFIEIIWSI